VLWNFQSTSQNIDLTNNGEIFQGIILAPDDNMSISHAILQGRFFGGDGGNMQIVSGANIVPAPLIGRGLPVLLAVGGVLFGAKLLERSRRRRSFAAV
jgi:hypothetical protein